MPRQRQVVQICESTEHFTRAAWTDGKDSRMSSCEFLRKDWVSVTALGKHLPSSLLGLFDRSLCLTDSGLLVTRVPFPVSLATVTRTGLHTAHQPQLLSPAPDSSASESSSPPVSEQPPSGTGHDVLQTGLALGRVPPGLPPSGVSPAHKAASWWPG